REEAGPSCRYEHPAVICSAKQRQTVVSEREEEGERGGRYYGSQIRQKGPEILKCGRQTEPRPLQTGRR
ncbi:unnamed protein product, partial [Tetraodon nigroviridis]